MCALVLLVEDNPDVLLNLRITLEVNEFTVLTATNGEEALQLLETQDPVPDIIISDIMMPKMNGYDFFKTTSKNPRLNLIPFIFLSAKASPQDVRFGKILGVDDYLTKPIRQDDLIASIKGRLNRQNTVKSIIENTLRNATSMPSISVEDKESVILLNMIWETGSGPTLDAFFTRRLIEQSIADIGNQLFQSVIAVYGHNQITTTEDILMTIQNYDMMGFLYYDFVDQIESINRQEKFMLAVLASKINYFDSRRIKTIFSEIARKIKNGDPWEPKLYWTQITEILSTH